MTINQARVSLESPDWLLIGTLPDVCGPHDCQVWYLVEADVHVEQGALTGTLLTCHSRSRSDS